MNTFCPGCRTIGSGKFCAGCGEPALPAMLKCPHCSFDVSVYGKFCENCGRPIQEAVQEHINRERGGEKSRSNEGTNGAGEGNQGSG